MGSEQKSMHRLTVAGLVLMFWVWCSPVFSQLSSGTVLGTVSDASGALIPGVEVKVSNSATGVTRETMTNESGNYRVDQLPVGIYVVETDLSGFKKGVHSGVNVDIDARVRIDFALSPGDISEVVDVTSAAPLVQTDDSTVGQVVDERKIMTLPLNGRDFSQLAYIVPGAYAPRPGSSLGNRGGFSVAGLNENTNQFLLDGINNNGTGTMEIAARVNVDAVGEFKAQTNAYSAQYGRYAGAQVDVVTKSGTNDLHGSGFFFARNAAFDARNVFDPYPLSSLPEFHRYQYGVTIGGPIIKNKLFYFGGYQGQRQNSFQTTSPSVPLPQFWSGDLSAMPQNAVDPLTGQPFLGNIIPSNRIDPISLKFRPYWPEPVRQGLSQNGHALLPQPDNFNQPMGKIDWNISPSHAFHGSYNYFNDTLIELPIAGNPEVAGFSTNSKIISGGLSLSEVWTISPTKVNEFRAGYGRVRRERFQQDIAQNLSVQFGILGTTADVDPIAWGLPYVTIAGLSRIGDNTNMPQPRADQTYTVTDNLSIVRGNHALKFGGDYYLQLMNLVLISNGRGTFDFNGSRTGNPFADFLLGLPDVTQRQPPLGPLSSDPRRTSSDWFFQDDWKLRHNLTLNLGLRYEFTGHLREKYGKLATFDPTLNGGKGGMLLVGNSPRFDNAVATFQALYPTLTIVRGAKQLYKDDVNNFAPRVGFAYSPLQSTVIRAAYGVFYNIDPLCFCDYYQNPPFNLGQRFTTADGITWENPWGVAKGTGIQMSGLDQNMAEPYYQEWNFGVQHEVPGGVVLDVSYQGKKGTKLARDRDINQPLDRTTGIRPYTNFSKITYLEYSASSIYHGLHTRIEKRTQHNQTFLLSYIFSKMIDDASSSPQDSYNLHAERSLSSDDVRHRFSASFVAPLPFGPGQPFAADLSGISRGLFGDWELSGILRVNSGSPQTPNLSINNSGTGNTGWDRPNGGGNPVLSNPAAKAWWNPAAFSIPAKGTFGNAGRNILIGPGAETVDFSLLKKIDVREQQQLQFRFELFNALNHPNYSTPALFSNASNFGAIASTLTAARQIQFGLKYLF
jgi:outer membrane receptor protein involved in Fe transport